MSENKKKEKYVFGGVKEFSLEEIESEILNESIYLDVFAGSDLRFKENITEVGQSLPLLNQLKTYKYNYKLKEFADNKFPAGGQIGLMAQEVEQVIPELTKKDLNGHMYVNYTGMVPLLVKGINELEARLKQSEQEIRVLKDLLLKK
jgi:hypothetical protein